MSTLGLPLGQSPLIQPGHLHPDTNSANPFPAASNDAILASFLQLLDQGQENPGESYAAQPTIPKWDTNGPEFSKTNRGRATARSTHANAGQLNNPQGRVPDDKFRNQSGNIRSHHRKSPGRPSTKSDEDRRHRQKLLERNRMAAIKCRQKKKEENMQLESRFQEQSEKKERLSAEVSKLRSEAIGLKNEVLKHVACGDKSVSRHLERSVMSIANSGASPELVSVAGGAGAGVDADSTTSLPDAVWPLAQVTSPPGCQNEGLFDQQIVGSPGPKPRQDSWGSMESMLSDELSMDDCFNDLVNI